MIRYFDEAKTFVLETAHTTYAFGLNDAGVPIHIYYGKKLLHPVDLYVSHSTDEERFTDSLKLFEYRQEYVTACRGVYDEECLRLRHGDGVCDAELHYASHLIEKDLLTVTLVDAAYGTQVRLCYRVWYAYDMIERWAEILCNEDGAVLQNAACAALYLPSCGDYMTTTYAGGQKREYTPVKTPLTEGKRVIETRRGACAGPHHAPFFTVTDARCPTSERAGEVYLGMIRHAGNFKIVFEKNHAGTVKITAGINFYDTAAPLKKGEVFSTPSVLFGYFQGGYATMRERLYDLEYDALAPAVNIKKPFPIIYNSWYPYRFDTNEEKLLALVDRAKELGAELLVIDDGWMSERTSDKGGLGDWYADPVRFPSGLSAISRACHEKGLLFGLWVEPEMITADTALYRRHPDWVLRYTTREPSKMRNQMVLNLAREDVYAFAEETMDRLVEEHALDYLKWDMNRYIAETDGTPDFYIRYARNVERLYRHVREKFPTLLIENCAHGGARADMALFPYCDRINRSDNSDPVDVLCLHENFTDLFPPRYAGGAGNVSISPNTTNGRCAPLDYRLALGMTGSMSIGFNILTATEVELVQTKAAITYYKAIRPILHNAYVYKLSSAVECQTVAWQYTARDRRSAVLFLFAHGLHYGEGLTHVRPLGLLADGVYEAEGKWYYGDTLMSYGLAIDRPKGDYYSKIIEIRKVESQ